MYAVKPYLCKSYEILHHYRLRFSHMRCEPFLCRLRSFHDHTFDRLTHQGYQCYRCYIVAMAPLTDLLIRMLHVSISKEHSTAGSPRLIDWVSFFSSSVLIMTLFSANPSQYPSVIKSLDTNLTQVQEYASGNILPKSLIHHRFDVQILLFQCRSLIYSTESINYGTGAAAI